VSPWRLGFFPNYHAFPNVYTLRGAIIRLHRRNSSGAFTPLYFTNPLLFQEAPNERAQILSDVKTTSGYGEFDQTLFVDDNVGRVG